jgi:protein gp37
MTAVAELAPVDRGTSAIEWTERTINPWTGCTKVSPGCAHCYIDRSPAFRIAGRRFEGGTVPLRFHLERLDAVMRRRKPTLYFVNSLSDVFHEDVPMRAVAMLFAAMAKSPQHTFQLLTKRPERMHQLLTDPTFWLCVRIAAVGSGWKRVGVVADVDKPLANVWLGVTVENRRFVERADILRVTPAAVRFISAEPLLGPLVCERCQGHGWFWSYEGAGVECTGCDGAPGRRGPSLNLAAIDWLIVGGESGPKHRRIDPQWVRDLRGAAERAGTAFLFKQWGGARPKSGGRELDGRTWDELPARATSRQEVSAHV